MRDFLISILGTYSAPTYEHFVSVYDTATQKYETVLEKVIPDGLAGVDWLYVLTGVLFVVVVYSVLKLLGGLICKIS